MFKYGCDHFITANLTAPSSRQAVHNDECTLCFNNPSSPNGIDVCLICFNGACAEPGQSHSADHFKCSNHGLVLNIQHIAKQEAQERPEKLQKLSIDPEPESSLYDVVACFKCLLCDKIFDITDNRDIADPILNHSSFSKQSTVQAWKNELESCEHTQKEIKDLTEPLKPLSLNEAKCSECDLIENLWVCLYCGNLACGRSQIGGLAGNGHALQHYEKTTHPISVKLGSISPEGDADVFCYSCQEDRKCPDLPNWLDRLNIKVEGRTKTEKSLLELQIEQNQNWDFKLTGSEGVTFEPVSAAGFVPFRNTGNTCYISSTLQILFSLECFQKRYLNDQLKSSLSMVADPSDNLDCQLMKLADGLLTNKYLDQNLNFDGHCKVNPLMLKHVIGRNHPEFSTMRQQDAFEFMLHFLSKFDNQSLLMKDLNPITDFQFETEDRFECQNCQKVMYRQHKQEGLTLQAARDEDYDSDTTLSECINAYFAPETIQFKCPHCITSQEFTKQTSFKTFPKVLCLSLMRYRIKNWVPEKFQKNVKIQPDEAIDLLWSKSKGPQGDEDVISTQESFSIDEDKVSQLAEMGIDRTKAIEALKANENADLDSIIAWVFDHQDESPALQGFSSNKTRIEANPERVSELEAMEFDTDRAKYALSRTNNDMESAIEWLLSGLPMEQEETEDITRSQHGLDLSKATYNLDGVICHKGTSAHVGHYVSYIKKVNPNSTDSSKCWYLFNDEKIMDVKCDLEEAYKTGYVYFFTLDSNCL